jgi:hypothetical protein
MRSGMSESLKNAIKEIAMQLQEPFVSGYDCKNISRKAYEGEDLICEMSQLGLDASYWAFGGLALFMILQCYAVRKCVERLDTESKWLVMAYLLKNQFGDVSK